MAEIGIKGITSAQLGFSFGSHRLVCHLSLVSMLYPLQDSIRMGPRASRDQVTGFPLLVGNLDPWLSADVTSKTLVDILRRHFERFQEFPR